MYHKHFFSMLVPYKFLFKNWMKSTQFVHQIFFSIPAIWFLWKENGFFAFCSSNLWNGDYNSKLCTLNHCRLKQRKRHLNGARVCSPKQEGTMHWFKQCKNQKHHISNPNAAQVRRKNWCFYNLVPCLIMRIDILRIE